jgi:hypothetical protein
MLRAACRVPPATNRLTTKNICSIIPSSGTSAEETRGHLPPVPILRKRGVQPPGHTAIRRSKSPCFERMRTYAVRGFNPGNRSWVPGVQTSVQPASKRSALARAAVPPPPMAARSARRPPFAQRERPPCDPPSRMGPGGTHPEQARLSQTLVPPPGTSRGVRCMTWAVHRQGRPTTRP